MTLDWLDRQGIICSAAEDYQTVSVRGGQHYHPFDETIAGDYSSAAFFFAAAAVTAGKLTVTGLDPDDSQGDRRFLSVLEEMGCNVETGPDSVTVEILCNFAERLFTYSLKENKIVKLRNLPKEIIGSEDFIRLDTAQYAFFKPRKAFLSNKNDEYKINILNLNTNKIERQFIPITPNDEYICFSQTRRFHKRDGKCLYCDVFSPGISKARCANQLSAAAPCQCFTLAGMCMMSPGCSSTAGFPSS